MVNRRSLHGSLTGIKPILLAKEKKRDKKFPSWPLMYGGTVLGWYWDWSGVRVPSWGIYVMKPTS